MPKWTAEQWRAYRIKYYEKNGDELRRKYREKYDRNKEKQKAYRKMLRARKKHNVVQIITTAPAKPVTLATWDDRKAQRFLGYGLLERIA